MNQHPAYELFEELGRGANTVVYRSYDLSLGREVAIKELNEDARRDPRHRERFLREAQFLAQFEHDNVLRVYSVDTERGWIIMELMKGTLASIIAAGPSSPDLVRSVLKQTLDALAFLHDKNKVHGTVRPTNLLINEVGRVKLSEFEQTDVAGELRAPKGSKKYLAPELIRPEFGEFGPPLDLYCLGFTALELLKGPQFEDLFPGTGKGAIDADIAWLRWHSSTDELPSVRKLVRGIPDDLAHVLDQILKKRVSDRPQSAQAVLKELADRPLVAVPVAGASDEEIESESEPRPLQPAIVRRIAEQQTITPYGAVVGEKPQPAAEFVVPASAGSGRQKAELRGAKKGWAAKKQSGRGKPAPPTFSRDWFNQQLGRPWVLYPLCAAILLGALWLTVYINSGKESTPADTSIPVAFDVAPDATGLEVVENDKPLAKSEDGTIDLEREKPKLPASLISKPGAEIDPDVQLPVRVLAAKFATDEPLELVLIKPGTYSYGAPDSERRDSEISKRMVQLEQPYYIAIHETTNAQYQRFFESEGPSRAGDRWLRAASKWAMPLKLDAPTNYLPVTNVSPEQAQAFCAWIGGRLPTEIEWESAVRGPADRGYPFPWGDGEPSGERCRIFYGDDLGAGLGGPVPVNELAAGASPLGLMHAIGNAAEWCQNSERSGTYILRGCSIGTANINDVRVTWRATGNARGEEDTGFRVVIPATESLASPPQTILGTGDRESRAQHISQSSSYWFLNLVPWENLGRSIRLR